MNVTGVSLLSCSWSDAPIIRLDATTPGSGPGWSRKRTEEGERSEEHSVYYQDCEKGRRSVFSVTSSENLNNNLIIITCSSS